VPRKLKGCGRNSANLFASDQRCHLPAVQLWPRCVPTQPKGQDFDQYDSTCSITPRFRLARVHADFPPQAAVRKHNSVPSNLRSCARNCPKRITDESKPMQEAGQSGMPPQYAQLPVIYLFRFRSAVNEACATGLTSELRETIKTNVTRLCKSGCKVKAILALKKPTPERVADAKAQLDKDLAEFERRKKERFQKFVARMEHIRTDAISPSDISLPLPVFNFPDWLRTQRGELDDAAKDQYEFRLEAGDWIVTFESVTRLFHHVEGMRYIYELLVRTQPIPAIEMASLSSKKSAVNTNSPEASNADVAELKARIQKAKQKLSGLDKDFESREFHQTNEHLEHLLQEYSRVTGIGGRARPPKAVENARASVTKAIERAILQIGKKLPKLAEHFDASISSGNVFTYQPRSHIDWRL
jgi:hypothetical protein